MPTKTYAIITAFFLLGILSLAACTGNGASGNLSAGAEGAVEAYFKALTEENLDQMIALSCADWEAGARLEFDAFAGVSTSLDNLQCRTVGNADQYTLVSCEGAILATYGDEQQSFDLSRSTYQVVEETGEWRMCGY